MTYSMADSKLVGCKEEEALAQALSHADMGPGEELTPEEEEELQYTGENQQRSGLEQVIVQHIIKKCRQSVNDEHRGDDGGGGVAVLVAG